MALQTPAQVRQVHEARIWHYYTRDPPLYDKRLILRSLAPSQTPRFYSDYMEPSAEERTRDLEAACQANPGDNLVTVRFVWDDKHSVLVTTGASKMYNHEMCHAVVHVMGQRRIRTPYVVTTREYYGRWEYYDRYHAWQVTRTMGSLAALAFNPAHAYPCVRIKRLEQTDMLVQWNRHGIRTHYFL